jgi:threonine synthase
VVVLVTGTGLKTPQIVETRAGVEVEADVDELLEHIGVMA